MGLHGKQNRALGPCLTAAHRILVPVELALSCSAVAELADIVISCGPFPVFVVTKWSKGAIGRGAARRDLRRASSWGFFLLWWRTGLEFYD
jgi:hypothetical protein